MKILFCNIAWMDYYKGITGKDKPKNGGSFVDEIGDAAEAYNFDPVFLTDSNGEELGKYCLGFVETKWGNGKDHNQLRFENICGCEDLENEDSVDDVLVVFCAKFPYALTNETYIVGWYNHATVYRYCQEFEFAAEGEDEPYIQLSFMLAKAEDCVLMPTAARRNFEKWRVPRKKNGISYGFGQANVWYARDREENKALDDFLNKIVKNIEEYNGENWVYKNPDE